MSENWNQKWKGNQNAWANQTHNQIQKPNLKNQQLEARHTFTTNQIWMLLPTITSLRTRMEK